MSYGVGVPRRDDNLGLSHSWWTPGVIVHMGVLLLARSRDHYSRMALKRLRLRISLRHRLLRVLRIAVSCITVGLRRRWRRILRVGVARRGPLVVGVHCRNYRQFTSLACGHCIVDRGCELKMRPDRGRGVVNVNASGG